MAGYNKVILIGNLTRDPVAGTIPNSGTSVCDFSLAMNRRWKDANGNEREEVLFMDCTAFGKQAETIARTLTKGRALHVEGRLKLDRWEQDGQRRSKVRVVVERFRYADGPRKEAGVESTDRGGRDRSPRHAEGRSERRPARSAA